MPTLNDFLSSYKRLHSVMLAEQESGFTLPESRPETGFYVYILIDPRDDSIFYIGKGIGGRVLKHAERTRRGVVENRKKTQRMQEIYGEGLECVWRLLFISDVEEAALAVEMDAIHQLAACGICNVHGGEAVQNPKAQKIGDQIGSLVRSFRQAWNAQ